MKAIRFVTLIAAGAALCIAATGCHPENLHNIPGRYSPLPDVNPQPSIQPTMPADTNVIMTPLGDEQGHTNWTARPEILEADTVHFAYDSSVVRSADKSKIAAVADYKGKIITFGFGASNDLFATDIVCGPSGTEFSLNDSRHRFFIPMLGRHSACNALAAIAVAKRLGVSEEEMIAGLHDSDGPEMRLQLQSAGPVLLLNDAYNANPNSMRAAIETTAGLESKGRRIAVLGDMRELGRSSERYHREIGQIAANTGKFDLLFCVGPQSKFVAEAAKQTGYPANQIIWIQDSATASNKIPALLQKDDLVLLKASRGIRLEAVASAIFDRYTARTVMAARVAS